MKKCRYVWLLTVICIIVLQLVACGNDANTDNGNDGLNSGITGDGNGEGDSTTDGGDGTEDNKPGFTVAYDLNELRTYFESGHQNESMWGLGGEKPKLTREAVRIKYPIEIERTSEDVGETGDRPIYAMYKVSQGGYYYVWWRYSTDSAAGEKDSYVYFSAYLTSDRSFDMFNSIVLGESTFADVKEIDPYFQFSNRYESTKVFSYCYVNEKIVLSMRSAKPEDTESDYDDYIVESIEIKLRDDASHCEFSRILPDDLPFKTGNNNESTDNENDANKDLTEDIPKNELVFTEEYDLDELRTYFESGHQNDITEGGGQDKPKITYDEVKQRFPIEITRTYMDLNGGSNNPAYTIYKVSQGGYYYVLWSYSAYPPESEKDFYVYFSTYIVSDRSFDMFNSIVLGESTLADVKEIDLYTQACFEFSSFVRSYSYINERIVLTIYYTSPTYRSSNDEDYVVANIAVSLLNDVGVCMYSRILPGDLP